jgi:hypothetical protein
MLQTAISTNTESTSTEPTSTESTSTELTSTEPNLYDRDFQLWFADTVAKLRSGDFQNVDIENLVEEIEALGKRDQRETRIAKSANHLAGSLTQALLCGLL